MPIIKKRYTICNSCGYVGSIKKNAEIIKYIKLNQSKNLSFNIYDECGLCGFINKFSKEINDSIKADQNVFLKKKTKTKRNYNICTYISSSYKNKK
jgi:hypothetical protein